MQRLQLCVLCGKYHDIGRRAVKRQLFDLKNMGIAPPKHLPQKLLGKKNLGTGLSNIIRNKHVQGGQTTRLEFLKI
jgi:hypothetical protein